MNKVKVLIKGDELKYEGVLKTLEKFGGKNINDYIFNDDSYYYTLDDNDVIQKIPLEKGDELFEKEDYLLILPSNVETYVENIKANKNFTNKQNCKRCKIKNYCNNSAYHRQIENVDDMKFDDFLTNFFSSLCDKYDINSIKFDGK